MKAKRLRIVICVLLFLLATFLYLQNGIIPVAAQELAIPQTHPRVWWTSENLIQAKQWYATHPFNPAIGDPWGNALRYVLTGETNYARNAINSLMSFTISDYELNGLASNNYRWNDWVPVVFDWCYNDMTPEERTTFITRYNTYVDAEMNKLWGQNLPSGNYYWGRMRNEINWAIATYYENASAQTYLDHALITRWQNSFLPYAANAGKGGVPQEGSQYGRYMLQYPLVPFTTLKLLGRDIYNETNFYKEAIFYLIYSTTPSPTSIKGSSNTYYQVFPFNDDEANGGYPTAVSSYYGDFMTTLANQWSDLLIGQYAKAWLNMVMPPVTNYVQAINKLVVEQDFNTLPLDYYAPGIKYFYTRNIWDPRSTVINLQLGNPVGVGHGHLDYGTFQIWRNGRWLSKETTDYSANYVGGSASSTIVHNGIIFNGRGWDIGVANAYAYGVPQVSRVESQQDYSYAVVDLSKAYRANSTYKNADGSPRDDNPFVKSVIREFVFIRPLETLVIFDRLESISDSKWGPLLPAEDVVKKFIIHFPEQPQIGGSNNVIGVNGNQALRLTTLVPSSPTYNVVDEGAGTSYASSYKQYRLEVSTSGQAQSYFLNVLQAKDTTGANLDATFMEDANSFTVNLHHPALGDAVIMFNKGMNSTGGFIGYSSFGSINNLNPFIDRIQGIEVTDNGPVWESIIYPSNPLISNILLSNVTNETATISWLTDRPTNSIVEYGNTNYANVISDANMKTEHSSVLTNLSPGAIYHFRVKSLDSSVVIAISGDFTFTTGTPLGKPGKPTHID